MKIKNHLQSYLPKITINILHICTHVGMYTSSPSIYSTYYNLKENVHKTASLSPSFKMENRYVYFQILSFLVDNNVLRVTRWKEPESE